MQHSATSERQEKTFGQPHIAGSHAEKNNNAEWAALLSVTQGQLIQELGWDEDCDSSISEALEEAIGEPLLEEDTDEIVDAVLLWWREEDGDLVDGLVDASRCLSDEGRIWLLTPAAGAPGTIEAGVINESAQLAGMVQTKSERLGGWQGACLVARGYKR